MNPASSRQTSDSSRKAGKYSDEQIYRSIALLRNIVIAGIALLAVVGLIALMAARRAKSFEETARYQPPPEAAGTAEPSPDGPAAAVSLPVHPVRGQLVYVPAYSHIYHRDGDPHLLTVTLSVRNTSLAHALVVKSVRYHNTQGEAVKSYLKQPLRLAPLATAEFLVEQADTSGGSGASFLVEWVSDKPVTNPVIEAVMIDTNRQQGISFARAGTVLRETEPPPNPPAETPAADGNADGNANESDDAGEARGEAAQ